MNPLGVFGEGEINGKPFHIFNFLSQTNILTSSSDEAAIDFGSNNLPPLQPLFICQSFRWSYEWLHRRENAANPEDFVLVDDHPHVFNKTSGDEQFQLLIGSETYELCKLPLVPLHWCNNNETQSYEFCSKCGGSEFGTDYYFCEACCKKFHKECIECPLEIKHPSYPFLSLKLYYPPHLIYLNCVYCRKPIYDMLYYCPTYKLILHPVCAMKPILILINHPKRHFHPLTFFPKQNSLVCDVCGMINEHFPTYVCARCIFVVHQDCIYSPYVIRISRHQHRISFTSSLPSGKWSCGVCRRKVDNNYSAYSCKSCDDYFVHTRCALRRDLWDGKELEGIPEEPEIDVHAFKRIDDGIILHFSHDHHLKLEISGFFDEGKLCQACILPIYDGNYYSCTDQCNFILHEACASAPCKKQHPLHAHSLTLKVVTSEYAEGERRYFLCRACQRPSCGFVYENVNEDFDYRLDLRCALVSEPFEYEGHEHPLFLALTLEEEKSAICQICQEKGDKPNNCSKLTCVECDFIICFACATLPYKARYKHDKHLLTFREKEEGSDCPGWCDRCESKIVYSRKGGYYSCDDYCSTTLHVDCLLGKDPYMKPGHNIKIKRKEVHILVNKTMSWPFCYGKKHHCQGKVVFKMGNITFCSIYCLLQNENADISSPFSFVWTCD